MAWIDTFLPSAASGSFWSAGATVLERTAPALQTDSEADVVVVGAGVAGLSVAYMLGHAGFRVMVVDDGPIAAGETDRSTAHLSTALDDGFVALERMHGGANARLAAQSHVEAIRTVEKVVRTDGIDCGLSRLDGWLFAGRGQSPERLQEELEAAQRAGLHDIELCDRIPDLRYDTGIALRFPHQAQVDPLRYVLGLAAGLRSVGGVIHTGCHVVEVEGGSAPIVTLSHGPQIRARAVVVATHTPINDRFAIHTKQTATRSYVIAVRVPRGSVPSALYWDTETPYHYVRLVHDRVDADVLLVGGEDHGVGHDVEPGAAWAALNAWTRERFPVIGSGAQWSGQIMEPVDGLAYIGKNPFDDNVYVVTGDSGHGMTHGTIAGMLMVELIRGADHPWRALYDPARKPLSALGQYAAHNLDNARGYAGYLKAAKVNGVEEIPRNSGAVVRRGLAPVAVSCDAHGVRTSCSAVCPHLGAVVVWNADEHSWDCPAHGSRFDAQGHVLHGPANVDLPLAQEPTATSFALEERAGLIGTR